MLQILADNVISHDPGRGAYFPSITPLSDGTLIGCQHVGSSLCSPDNTMEVLRSMDGGRTWSNEGGIHGGNLDDGWSYRLPLISETPSGELIMMAGRFLLDNDEMYNPATEGVKPIEMLLYRSDDKGASWSDLEVVPAPLPKDRYVCCPTGQLIQLSPTRWMYPFECWKPDGYEGPVDQKAGAAFSADQGKTWDEFSIMADDQVGSKTFGDPMNVRLPDGRLYTMAWTRTWGTDNDDDLNVHFVISEDEGRTWSEPEPTNIQGQLCGPIPLPDGRVAAVYNYRKKPEGVRVAVSTDLKNFDLENEVTVFDAHGETYTADAVDEFIDKHQKVAFGRPWGVALSDTEILTWFWCTRAGVTHTRCVRVAVAPTAG